MEKFKIGDKVQIVNYHGCNPRIKDGMVGKVVDLTDSDVGVEFDKNIWGHDCDGKGKSGHCWEFAPYNLREEIIMEKFNQLCIWPATMLGDSTAEEFEKFFSDEFNGVRVKFAEEVITNGSLERNEEGGRHDLLFFVHDDDIAKFAVPRLQFGIRWWEDVVKYNDCFYLYSEEILNKYPVTW